MRTCYACDEPAIGLCDRRHDAEAALVPACDRHRTKAWGLIYWCAGPSCPGLPYRASDMPHPATCSQPSTDSHVLGGDMTPKQAEAELQAIDEDVELAARDQSVIRKVRTKLADLRAAAADARYEAAALERHAARIVQDVRHEKWWELSDLLTEEEVESLCEKSPTYLLEEIGEL